MSSGSPLPEKKSATHNSFPSKNEGRDGEQRFVLVDGSLYFMRKEKEIWYKVKMEKV